MFLKLSKFFLYTSLFSVVIVLPSTFFPFIAGKDVFFRIAVELALIFFTLWWAFEARPGEASKLFRTQTSQPLFIAVSVFVLAFLLASVFADDPNAAFWSNYERGEGGFQMLHYYAFFTLLTLLFRKWTDWRRAFIVSLAAAILMVGYGFFAALSIVHPDFFCASFSGQRACVNLISPYGSGQTAGTFWKVLAGSSRFQGSLGNPAYVATYLLFSIFFTLYLWIVSLKSTSWPKWIRNSIYGVLVATFLFFFILSQTKGAFLGLGAAVFVFLGYLILFIPQARKVVASIFLALVIFSGAAYTYRDTEFVKKLPGSRVLQINYSERTVQTRLWTWGSAWQGFKERPFLGWGPENFATVFDKHFDPRHFTPGTQSETWFDRAHSVIFDYLAEIGIIGLMSYLSIFAVFYWQLLKKVGFPRRRGMREEKNISNIAASDDAHNSVFLHGLVFCIPVAYFVQGLALFDVLPIYINFFLVVAFALYLFSKPVVSASDGKTHRDRYLSKAPSLKSIIATAIVIAIAGVGYYGSYLPIKKSQAFIRALRNVENVQSFDEFEKTFNAPLSIISPVGHEELIRSTGNTILNLVNANDFSPELMRRVVTYLEAHYEPILRRGKGMSYSQNLYILGTLNQIAFAKTGNASYFESAKSYFSAGLEKNPRRPQFLFGMFDTYRLEGNTEGAISIAERILSHWPDNEQVQKTFGGFLQQQATGT